MQLENTEKINDPYINLDDKKFIKLENATKQSLGHIEFHNIQIRWIHDLTYQYNKLTDSNETDFSFFIFLLKHYKNI